MLPILLTIFASVAAVPAVADVPAQDPAIRVWLNKGDYVERTDKVRAYVRTGIDGFVVILHAEPSGRVRVLFPLDPEDDAWVRAGRDYEIRSRGDEEAFRVYDGTGPGIVLAAISRDPFNFEGLALNRHWDYRAAAFGVGNDGEADLLALVQQMAGAAWFDYSVTRYQVADYGNYVVADGGDGAYQLSLYGPAYAGHYWTGGVGFSIGFGFGWYDPWSWYDPWYWGSCCGYGWYYPWTSWGYGYGYGYYPYYPYYPYNPYYPAYPAYPGHYYATGAYGTGYYGGGAWGSYAFKSHDDRYGLSGGATTARRRALGTGSSYASTQSSPSAGGRRTTGISSPASAGTPSGATTGRRTTAASSATSAATPRTEGGSLEARRRPTGTAASPTVLPTISGRRRSVDTPSGTATPESRDAATTGRREVIPSTATPASREATRGRVPAASSSGASAARRPAGNSGIREITPRRVDDVTPSTGASRSSGRQPQGTVGSGSTSRSSGGSLERRTPSRQASPPSRSTPTTRSAPSRTSAPRAAPSRPSTTHSAPSRGSSGRSAAPSGGRSSSGGGRRR